jgi:hypothetical protein
MASKSAAMSKFVLGLIFLLPIGLVAGVIGIAWGWEYISGCFFSLSYTCGQDNLMKTVIFIGTSVGSFTLIKNLWDKTK